MKILLILACLLLGARVYWEMVKRRAVTAIEGLRGVEGDACVTKHEQIAVLESLGITLPSEDETYQFLFSCSAETSEWLASHPYWALLTAEGTIWNRVYSPGDGECIDDDDAYRPILEGLARISGLPLEHIRGRERYRAELTLAGTPLHYHARENRDWIDPKVGGWLNRQVERILPEAMERFWLDNTHSAPIWLWGAEALAKAVNQKTGLSFRKT